MPQLTLPFPKLGIIRSNARTIQNGQPQGYYAQFQPDSTWNAVNIVPYDRLGRLRGATRPGTLSLITLAANKAVVAMTQVISYPAVTTTTVLDDVFTGVAFPITLPIENNGIYSVIGSCATIPLALCTVTLPSDTIVDSTKGVRGIKRGTNYTSPFAYRTLPPQFADNFTATVTHALTAGQANASHAVLLRYDPVTNSGITILFQYNQGTTNNQVSIRTVVGSVTTVVANQANTQVGTAPASVVLSVVVAGNVITASYNGVQVCQGTTAVNAGKTGTGFYFWDSVAEQWITEFKVQSTNPPGQRLVSIVGISNGNVYEGLTPQTMAVVTSGTAVVATTNNILPSMTANQGQVYIVDGTSILQVDVPNSTMVTYTASTGTAPVGTTLATTWRGRLVLAHVPNFPQNFYMSRVNVLTDWDYSQVDPAAAFAGNASTAGHIGEPITALMPFNDDVLLIGGDHNLWRVNGDPADGGSIDLVSDTIGVSGPNAWCKDPSGNIWFAGAGGLYMIAPGGVPQNMTGKTFNLPFTLLDRTQINYTLTYDRDNQGLNIFFAPTSQAIGTHLWFDARNGGLWEWQYPANYGPVSVLQYDASSSSSRSLLLGCWDGHIRASLPGSLDDDGAIISTLLSLGPIQTTAANDAVITGVDITLGENIAPDPVGAINVVWTLKGGKSAYEVTEGTPRHTVAGTFTYPGRQITRHPRLRGGWFAVELSNNVLDTYWGLEQLVLTIESQGKQR